MKLRSERTALADTVTWVAGAIAGKGHASPVLAGVRLACSDGWLQATAFNYDVAHRAGLPVDEATPGECLVSGAFLRSVLPGLRGKEVELTLDGGLLTVASGRSTYRAQVMSLEDYPTLPTTPDPVGTVEAAALLAAIAAVRHPVDDGHLQEKVRGLRIDHDEDGLILIGTDGQRIALAHIEAATPLTVTVPVGTLEAAAKGLTGTVTLGRSGGVLGLADASRAVTIRTYVDGYMPTSRVQALLSVPAGAVAEVEADELRDAVRRVRVLADHDEATIAVSLLDGEIHISTVAEGSEGDEYVAAKVAGGNPDQVAGFNPRYLAEALAAVPSGAIELRAPAERGPWLLQPLDHPHLTLAVLTKRLDLRSAS